MNGDKETNGEVDVNAELEALGMIDTLAREVIEETSVLVTIPDSDTAIVFTDDTLGEVVANDDTVL